MEAVFLCYNYKTNEHIFHGVNALFTLKNGPKLMSQFSPFDFIEFQNLVPVSDGVYEYNSETSSLKRMTSRSLSSVLPQHVFKGLDNFKQLFEDIKTDQVFRHECMAVYIDRMEKPQLRETKSTKKPYYSMVMHVKDVMDHVPARLTVFGVQALSWNRMHEHSPLFGKLIIVWNGECQMFHRHMSLGQGQGKPGSEIMHERFSTIWLDPPSWLFPDVYQTWNNVVSLLQNSKGLMTTSTLSPTVSAMAGPAMVSTTPNELTNLFILQRTLIREFLQHQEMKLEKVSVVMVRLRLAQAIDCLALKCPNQKCFGKRSFLVLRQNDIYVCEKCGHTAMKNQTTEIRPKMEFEVFLEDATGSISTFLNEWHVKKIIDWDKYKNESQMAMDLLNICTMYRFIVILKAQIQEYEVTSPELNTQKQQPETRTQISYFIQQIQMHEW